MTNNFIEGIKPRKIASKNGIDVYKLDTSKFKTNQINIFFHDNLSKDRVGKNALIPAVLRRGSKNFPTSKDLSIYFEELYGAVFDCTVNKKGENHLVHFFMEFISDTFSEKNELVFEKAFDCLYEVVFEPKLVDGAFDKEYFEQEKNNIVNIIESKVNDKQSYALLKCIEEMCKDEPYGIYELGDVDTYKTIDEKNLYDYYKEFITNVPISVFISGNIDDSEILRVTEKLFKLKRENMIKIEKACINVEVKEVREVIETMSVNQGKLSLGYRTYVEPNSDEYYALLVCNSILGGGIHSKLFQNVREKESLAYYAFSRLEKYKGLMVLSSGIETDKKEKVIDIMNKQVEDIQNGVISDYEYDISLKVIESSINSMKDSQYQVMDFYLSQSMVGTNENLESVIEKCKKVTREDIQKVAKKLKLDTVYFLTKS